MVVIADMAEVRRIARRSDRPILHHGARHRAALLVDDGHTVYRYAEAGSGDTIGGIAPD